MELYCKKIINILQDCQYHTAAEIADILKVSDKTIRKIREIVNECNDCIGVY